MAGAERLDFNLAPEKVPAEWPALREEARPLLRGIHIWRAELAPVQLAEGANIT